jgi:serine protease Do
MTRLLLSILVVALVADSQAADDLAQREERAMLAAVERVAPSVVSIETVGGLERVGQVLFGTGPTTGLVVSADGYIVSSAFNFAQKPSSILVGRSDGTRTPARLVATDRSRMLVLLKINVEGQKLTVPEMVDEKDLAVGQWSIAVGRTFDPAKPSLSVGIISGLDRVWGKAIQTDAKISPSNYGGPLIDIRGRVMGVLVPLSPTKTGEMAGIDWYDSGIGFAVPMKQVYEALPRLAKGKDLLPGVMGIVFKGNDLYSEPPVLSAARPNSPAYHAGLKAGDKIVAINDHAIEWRAQLTHEVNQHYAGDKIRVTWLRGKERIERELELVDKLDPYARPFLGILPRRGTASKPGVVVRYVYQDSPAAKAGLKEGDRITQVDDKKVADRDELIAQLAPLAVGQSVKLEVARGSETLKLAAKLGIEPTENPQELPAAWSSRPKAEGERPKTGAVKLKSPDFPNDCLVYVPENYNPAIEYGVVIWLHGPGGFEDDKLIARWKALCERDDFLLVAPKSGDPARWAVNEGEFVVQMIERVQETYHFDPLRTMIHGYQGGGGLACLVAFNERSLVQGIAVVQGPIVGQLPENDPEVRQAFYIATAKEPDLSRPLAAIKERKFSLVERSLGEKGRYLTDDELADLLRWFDALDRI